MKRTIGLYRRWIWATTTTWLERAVIETTRAMIDLGEALIATRDYLDRTEFDLSMADATTKLEAIREIECDLCENTGPGVCIEKSPTNPTRTEIVVQ